ncbi:GNAT family N-acetyltransferase [Nocardia mexicana]|uniref:Acetyltransferase (GNAT) family protein n=1 Tax=Nocardia mexicana TaxID=279262 RepID=A0A370GZF1_9NOCA|nr:GNAT family N-acetyltransferase [Nocardia mexicana]RDI48882.1 acetyltransferase (GNAT) family protein [Nocardia mexicana]
MESAFLRPAAAADEPFLWSMLFEASHAEEQGMVVDDLRSLPELARYVEKWGGPDDLGVIGGSERDEPLGAAWIRLFTSDNAAYGFVDEHTPELAIGVAPSARGTGLGTALLTRLLDDARTRYDGVCLSVRETNPARRLYERLGFEFVPGSEKTNRVGTTSITMLHRFPAENTPG